MNNASNPSLSAFLVEMISNSVPMASVFQATPFLTAASIKIGSFAHLAGLLSVSIKPIAASKWTMDASNLDNFIFAPIVSKMPFLTKPHPHAWSINSIASNSAVTENALSANKTTDWTQQKIPASSPPPPASEPTKPPASARYAQTTSHWSDSSV